MKKIYPSNMLSDKKCAKRGCDKKLKLRIAIQHPKFKFCYDCFKDMCVNISSTKLKRII
jgi:hypothetical protein